jgi:hypothetical protein
MDSTESGNALIYILIVIALFAAFSYAVTIGSRAGVQTLTEDKEKLLSAEIIEYGDIVANAATQLRLRGYSVNQISFEDPMTNGHATFDDYVNASCGGVECFVFDPSGGGVKWKEVPEGLLVPESGQKDYAWWSISGAYSIKNVGTDCTSGSSCKDLILFLNNVRLSVCKLFNEHLGIDNPASAPPEAAIGYDPMNNHFHGTYDSGNGQIAGKNTEDAVFHGKMAGCFSHTTPVANTYMYYQVLLPR